MKERERLENGQRIRVWPPVGLRVRLPNLKVVDGEGAEVIVDKFIRQRLAQGDLLTSDPRSEKASARAAGDGSSEPGKKGKHAERFARESEG